MPDIEGFNPYKDIPFTLVAVDYDGTLVNDYHQLDVEAIECLRDLSVFNIKFILWSCRPVDFLKDVAENLKDWGIHFIAINDNCQEIKDAYEVEGRKVFSHFYIDDQACGFRRTDWKDIYDMITKFHIKRVRRGDCKL